MNTKYCAGCMEHLEENGLCKICSYLPNSYVAKNYYLPVGIILNKRYLVGRVMGQGGFGITYMGRDLLLDTKVVIKELYISSYVHRNANLMNEIIFGNEEDHRVFLKCQKDFDNEAKVLQMLSKCDGIVNLIDYFRSNNTSYIVLEFLNGIDLKNYLKRNGRIPTRRVCDMFSPIIKNLKEMHSLGIVHRDISPDNIMICDDGSVKLIDFGTAFDFSTKMVSNGNISLKPGYAPVEQYLNKKQGPYTDIYALCATFYRCISGFVPQISIERLKNDKLVPLVMMSCNCPMLISDVFMRGLSVDDKDRYQTIEQFIDALEYALVNAPHSIY